MENQKRYLLKWILLIFIIFFYACKEDLGTVKPIYNDGTAPKNVSDVKVINGKGRAVLTYKIPDDVDLSYIKARYEIRPGVYRETKSYKTNDSLVVDGFGEEKEYKVILTTLDIGENESKALEIKVNPMTPPIIDLVKTIQLIDDFGGIGIVIKNPSESDFTISVSEKVVTSNMERPLKTFYTKAKDMIFNIRGYDPKPVNFVVSIKDKYGNIATPIEKLITPIEELMLDRTLFRAIKYDNDTKPLNASRDVEAIWNNVFGDDAFHSGGDAKMPMSVTMDLGAKIKLSRFKYYPRTGVNAFINNHYNIKKFELYGSNNPSSDWSSWELMGEYDSFKPSGLPLGQITNDDVAYAVAGEEFNVKTTAPEVRYLRVKILESWSGLDGTQISEMKFWGQYK